MEEKICRAQCLVGKCPFDTCIKYRSDGRAQALPDSMQILTRAKTEINQRADGYGVAVDIGTTTVAVYLWNRETGICVAYGSEVNAQISMGLDVLSRIRYSTEATDGLSRLHDAVTGQLERMIYELIHHETIDASEIKYIVLTGNTTMLHLVSGISPASMGRLPFQPESQFGNRVKAGELGLTSLSCDVFLPGCPCAFVGADIVTAMLAAGFDKKTDTMLLMDIGTNGELALLHEGRIYAASTAAGPAFEGAELSCGMAGVAGAISAVSVRDGKIVCETIGGSEATGVCGSGVLDFIGLMLETGAIDESGAIEPDSAFGSKIDGQNALMLEKGIYLTQKDIRNIQAAKAAIAAGVYALAKAAGIGLDKVNQTYLAGGFGNYMDIASARKIGLIPPGIGSVDSIGNAAATGAALLLFPDQYNQAADWLFRNTVCVELGGDAYFAEKYVDCMYLKE